MIFKRGLLDRPVAVMMAFLLCILLGLIALLKLPLSLLPEQKDPWVSIITDYPGMSPEKIETLITKPIEEKIASVRGIEKIQSDSEEGRSRINVKFDRNRETDLAILDLRAAVDMVRPDFPGEVQEPVIIQYDPSQSPAVILSVWSDKYDTDRVRESVEYRFKNRFQRIDGVSEIFVSGGSQREIHVQISADRLNARGLDIRDVFREIQFANFQLSPGNIGRFGRIIPVSTAWKYTNIEQIADTIVHASPDGNVIRVRDIGLVIQQGREQESLSRIDMKDRVAVYIQRSGTANTVFLSSQVLREVKKLRKEYPDLKIDVVYDQADFIRAALGQALSAVVLGIVFAVFVLLLFLRSLKYTFLLALSMPVSIIVTFFFFYIKGISLNVFSLSGLALAAGMLVDNSILVLENIFVRRDVVSGVNGIEKAVLASTLTMVAVFLPVVFMSRENAILYGDVTMAIVFSILFSLATSLILLPIMIHQTKLTISETQQTVPHRFPVVISRLLGKNAGACETFYVRIMNILEGRGLGSVLEPVLRHPRRILVFSGIFILAGFLVIPSLKQEYIDPVDTGSIHITCELPSGASLERTDTAVRSIETALNAGLGKNIHRMSTRVDKAHSTIVIELNRKKRISSEKFIREAKKLTAGIRDADVIFSESSGGSEGFQKEIELNITGPDPEILKQIARLTASRLDGIPFVHEIIFHFKEPQEEIAVKVDRLKAVFSGLNAGLIANFLREAVYGPVTTKFYDKDREVDVRVMLDKKDLKEPEDVSRMFVRNNEGSLVPLSEVASIERGRASSRITRLNKHRAVSLAVKYEKADLNKMVRILTSRLRNMVLPDGYYFEFGDNYRNFQKNRNEMVLTVLLAIVLVYLILASIFENLFKPLIIILSIPLAVSSVLLGLALTGNSLNVSVYIGLVMLAGIVVSKGILIIDGVDAVREPGMDVRQAVIKSVERRIRPIIMTTMTAVLGLLPVLLSPGEGSNLWRPLALTVIIGLLAATVLTLFVIPAVYVLAYEKKWVHAKNIS
jgi:hydrophobic/amphiphilic exporter-1 (mainly G- bacteria), HAE1 family